MIRRALWMVALLGACDRGPAAPSEQPATPTHAPATPAEPQPEPKPKPQPQPEPKPQPKPAPKPEPPPEPRASTEMLTRAPRPDVSLRVWIERPDRAPTRTLVMLAGGSGKLGVGRHGLAAHAQDGVLARTRQAWLDAGFQLAYVDVPSDHADGLEGFRRSSDHADDLRDVIAELRARDPVPLWLVGTSRGTISAANAAARLGPPARGGPDGVVLCSPVTEGKHETLDGVALADIAVPVLVVEHRGDGCSASPPAGARRLDRLLRRSPRHALSWLGQASRAREDDPCESQTRHGYLGLESELIATITAFVRDGG